VSLVEFKLGDDLLFVGVAGGILVINSIIDEIVLAIIYSRKLSEESLAIVFNKPVHHFKFL